MPGLEVTESAGGEVKTHSMEIVTSRDRCANEGRPMWWKVCVVIGLNR